MELVCVNHWGVAIETHKRNHPEARHYVQDIATVRPHLLVPEGYLDLLMASPTCTHHSVARGGKPTSDQQRSDPWHIITWLTELRVKRIIIENVWEFTGWGPVDPRTGRPIKSRKGEYFRAWIDTLRRLGFDPEWRKLNAADYGDATTRQRFILMARSDSKTVSWPIPTHRKREDGRLELFPTMKPWKPAREIIDWSLKGRSIYTRPKGLAAKTLMRILAGVEGDRWPEPYVVTLRNHMAARGIDLPLPTIAAGGNHIGLAVPVPFVLSQGAGGVARSVDKPTPTIPTHGAHALIAPYYGSGSGETCRTADQPLPAATAKARFGLVVPVTHSQSGNRARSVEEPILTLTTAKGGEFGFITAQHGERPGQAPRVHSVDRPVPTIAATGHVDLVEPGPEYDILFRMLEPHELAAAMGFNDGDEAYDFAGTKTEQIKQIGNAVSVAKMKACVGAIMADAAPKKAAAPKVEAAAA
jgi:DNA (cytosine-5)-methyltransferase 1